MRIPYKLSRGLQGSQFRSYLYIATAVFTIALMVHFWDVLLHPTTMLIGSDFDLATGVTARLNEADHSPLLTLTTTRHAAPDGNRLWTAAQFSQLIQWVPMVITSRVLGPVFATNLNSMIGIGLSFFTGLALMNRLQINRGASVLLCYLFAFSPFAVMRAGIHPSFAHQWIYPVVTLFILRLSRKPTPRNGLVTGTVIGISAYVDGYFLVFAPIAGLAFLAWLTVTRP